MRTIGFKNTRFGFGYALILVMTFTGASLIVLSGVMSLASTSSRITERNNVYFSNSGASEAAAEKVIGAISQDYPDQGETWVYGNLNNYRAMVPSTSESPFWSGFSFSDGSGKTGAISVQRSTAWNYGIVPGKYKTLSGNFATYRVIASASTVSSTYNKSSAVVQQDIQLVSIPIFEYQLFYGLDMEICPGSDFTIPGRSHCNGNVYLQPSSKTVTFQSDVTAAGQIMNTNAPGDSVYRQFGAVTYQADHIDRARTLKIPLGVANTPDALLAMVQIPPGGETATSLIGQQRYYNKADMVVLIQKAGPTVTSGAYDSFGTTIPSSTADKFLNVGVTFFDKRENQTVTATELDVAQLNGQLAYLKTSFGRDVKTIYIADVSGKNTFPGVRIINGSTISSLGLTVATPHPLYVLGHFNTSGVNLGTTNTTAAYAASFVCDAITLLSVGWKDDKSTGTLSQRVATSTTVNAAVITGIVPSSGGNYSGGVENSLRLLEDWSGKTLTFNGAMAVLWNSRSATTPWGGTGQIYNTPTRNWSWDPDFATQSKLPPGTPEVRTVLRTQYSNQMVNSP